MDLTQEQLEELAAAGLRSPVEFARLFLPEWFPSKVPWVHRGIAALRTGRTAFLLDFGPELWPEDVENGTVSYWTPDDVVKIVTNFVVVTKEAKMRDGVVIEPEEVEPIFDLVMDGARIVDIRIRHETDLNAFIMPRGFSKTTWENCLNLRDVVNKLEAFILYVSETIGHASNQVMTIRTQLETNELIRLVYGNLVPDRSASNKWSDAIIEPTNGTRIAAVGSGGQVRGIVKDSVRPSRIVVDDFQDEESCATETQRAKDLMWFVRTLLPARKLFGANKTKVDVIGTLLHPEAVMAVLMKDPAWTRVRFGAIDRQGDMLWEYAISREKLAELRAQYERVGALDAFDYEYMSNVPLNDGIGLRVDKITYVVRPSEWFVAKAVVVDPAISENPKADFCALACLGMGKHGDINVIDFHAEVGMEFDAQAEKFFDFHFAHCLDLDPSAVKHGVEAIAYQRALMSLILSKQHEKSKTWGQRAYFEVTPITYGRQDGNKIMRVQGLLGPRMKSGHIEMSQQFPVLVGQMQRWGEAGSKKDGPDVIAQGIMLLDPYSQVLANAANDDEDPDMSVAAVANRLFNGRNWRKAP